MRYEEGKRQKGGNNGMPVNPPPKNLRPEPKLNILEHLKKHGSMSRNELDSFLERSDYPEFTYLMTKGKIICKNKLYCLPEKKSKYNNIKTVVDGHKFDSLKESRRYSELKIMEKAGLITNLALQPKFEIIPAVKWNGKTYRKRSYLADFIYKEDNVVIVEDVKSFITKKNPVYTLKRQLFLIKYPKYVFKEV